MPCSHLFHDECLVPWLERHNTCPVCRFELAMVLLFVVSYAFVARRKRRLLAIQHHRIAQYLS